MGYYVHISVTFSADKEPVINLAKEMLEKLTIDDSDGHREAKAMLKAFSEGNGYNCGWKGSIWSWGIVGNYTDGEKFVKCLKPFWNELIINEKGAFEFDHVIVFREPEQRGYAECWEIYQEENPNEVGYTGKLILKHHELLPFSWNQM